MHVVAVLEWRARLVRTRKAWPAARSPFLSRAATPQRNCHAPRTLTPHLRMCACALAQAVARAPPLAASSSAAAAAAGLCSIRRCLSLGWGVNRGLPRSLQQQHAARPPLSSGARLLGLGSRRSMAAAAGKSLQLEVVDVDNPKELNFILGHAHFIKTVEDIYEALVQSSPSLKFGVAFNEASPGYEAMPGRKVRFDGNDEELIDLAKRNALAIGAGHSFIVFLGEGSFPVNCLNAIKAVPEVCRIHCATANPTSVVLAKTSDDAKGILGVIDGVVPTEYESDDDKKKRHDFLRMIGYKR